MPLGSSYTLIMQVAVSDTAALIDAHSAAAATRYVLLAYPQTAFNFLLNWDHHYIASGPLSRGRSCQHSGITCQQTYSQ